MGWLLAGLHQALVGAPSCWRIRLLPLLLPVTFTVASKRRLPKRRA